MQVRACKCEALDEMRVKLRTFAFIRAGAPSFYCGAVRAIVALLTNAFHMLCVSDVCVCVSLRLGARAKVKEGRRCTRWVCVCVCAGCGDA